MSVRIETEAFEQVLSELMNRHAERVPDVARVLNTLTRAGHSSSPASIENDHIAFRTMGVPRLGIRSFEKIRRHYGYQWEDYYDFPVKEARRLLVQSSGIALPAHLHQ